MTHRTALKRTFKVNRIDILFIVNYLMLGVVMYWTGIVVQPTLDIAKSQQDEIRLGTEQQAEIIENGDNNTALLVELFERQNKLLANQIILTGKLANATQIMQQSSGDINEHIGTIIEESDEISQMITYFRQNFGERFVLNETTIDPLRAEDVRNNITEFANEVILLREELGELSDLLVNRTTNNP